MKRKLLIVMLVFNFLKSYSQEKECCMAHAGYENFVIKTNNNVDIGFKIQKRTNNLKGNNIYSVIGYAKNKNDYAVRNITPAKFKIIGIGSSRIPGVSYELDVSLGMGLDPHSSEVVIGSVFSVQEPFIKVDGFLYGIYKKQ